MTIPLLQCLCDEQTHFDSMSAWEKWLAALKQDVAGLLNSVAAPIGWPKSLIQLEQSIYTYGLKNFFLQEQLVGQNYISQHTWLCQHIQDCLIKQEPRLSSIQVSALTDELIADFVFPIRIDAKIVWREQAKAIVLKSDWNPLNMSFIVL